MLVSRYDWCGVVWFGCLRVACYCDQYGTSTVVQYCMIQNFVTSNLLILCSNTSYITIGNRTGSGIRDIYSIHAI